MSLEPARFIAYQGLGTELLDSISTRNTAPTMGLQEASINKEKLMLVFPPFLLRRNRLLDLPSFSTRHNNLLSRTFVTRLLLPKHICPEHIHNPPGQSSTRRTRRRRRIRIIGDGFEAVGVGKEIHGKGLK
jgi:hypothetical protein